MKTFKKFLEKNGLIEPETGRHLLRFAWCTDGPWDVCDFVVKQCFISKVGALAELDDVHLNLWSFYQIPVPSWISGDVIDVRIIVKAWRASQEPRAASKVRSFREADA